MYFYLSSLHYKKTGKMVYILQTKQLFSKIKLINLMSYKIKVDRKDKRN